jgi:hypothetical protein
MPGDALVGEFVGEVAGPDVVSSHPLLFHRMQLPAEVSSRAVVAHVFLGYVSFKYSLPLGP